MTSFTQHFLEQQSDTCSITFSTLFPPEIEDNNQLQQLHVFQSTTLQDHLKVLKRAHLDIPHIPKIKLVGDFHKNIEITMPIYRQTLLEQIKRYTHHQKLDFTIQILNTYQLLIKQYGYFFISHHHIRLSDQAHLVLWINPDFNLNFRSAPLDDYTQNPEELLVKEFIKIVKQFFTVDFFKYYQLHTFAQLETYLEFVKKRNKLHKKCSNRAKEQSESKRRNTMSVKNLILFDNPHKKYNRSFRPISSYSSLLTSNIFNRRSREIQPSQSLLNSSSVSRVRNSKGSNQSKLLKSEVDTTIVSSELKNTRNISYLQLSNIIRKSQKKSCVFGSNPQLVAENCIKHSTVLHRQSYNQKDANKFCPIEYKRRQQLKIKQKEVQKVKKSFIDKKTSLQIGLNSLLLSQINEDPQNETGGSDLKKRQHLKEVIQQFQTLLCN